MYYEFSRLILLVGVYTCTYTYRFQCLFHSAEKLLDVIKRSVPSEDADDENPVVTVYLSELFVKTQPNMTKSVSKYTCQIFF